MRRVLGLAMLTACAVAARPGAGGGGDDDDGGGTTPVDRDGDGLDDRDELRWATDYLPFLSADPADACPRGGIAVRVSPHPVDPSLVSIVYVYLFERECAGAAHVGDDDVFAITVNPKAPAGAGLIAVRARTPVGESCPRMSECGRCPGQTACESNGGHAVVYLSRGKHTSYAQLNACTTVLTCGDSCMLAPSPIAPPIVNVGEPGRPLVSDLTADGFITVANGWSEPALFHVDPWAPGPFGGAGALASDLTDPQFMAPGCR